MKNQKGITLIALIVTIIVLLILAGVALSGITGNEGILSKAETAVSETKIAGAKEQAELMLAEFNIEYYDARFVRKEPDAENQKVVDYVKTQFGSGKVTSNGEFYITMKDNAVIVYEGNEASAVAQKNKIAVGLLDEAGKIEWGEVVELPEGLEVGTTVTYSPSGTYNWQAKYASSDLADDGSADVMLASGDEVTSENQDMSLTSWRVFSINEITGNVELVPSTQTSKTVRLHGAQGYNNGVKLLNDACSSLYGNSSKGISARSINIEDIENRMTEEALRVAHGYTNGATEYGKKAGSAYPIDKQYPAIYAREALSVIDGLENSDGLERSTQIELVERNDDGATLGKLEASTNIQPYHTYWTKDNTFMQTAFEGDGIGENNLNYDLLFPNGANTTYWLATRGVDANRTRANFLVFDILYGEMSMTDMCWSNSFAYGYARRLFPMVSLNANSISGNDTDGWIVQ